MKSTARRSTPPKHKHYRAEGPADGRFTKELFRGPRVRHPYPVGTLRSRACNQFCVVAYQTRLVSVVVLACWNCRCVCSDDNSRQPASTCGQERVVAASSESRKSEPIEFSTYATAPCRKTQTLKTVSSSLC